KWNIFALGYTGAGKTTSFLTFPGKKFAYLFDPSAKMALRGHDVDYEEFLPDVKHFGVTTLKKDKKTGHRVGDRPTTRVSSEAYLAWETHFEKALSTGFFDDYDAILFDSATTFLDIIMDRVLSHDGRVGQWPQQSDWGPQMTTFANVVRTATSLDKTLMFTGHVEITQDDLTSRVYQTPILTGKLKAKIPLLFSEVLFFECTTDMKGNSIYTVQTKPDRMMPMIRTTTRGLEAKENITLNFDNPLDHPLDPQGLYSVLIRGKQSAKVRSTVAETA
ncbi:MAG: ATP-binding protein, partial [Candidatus Bathyarchaeota archaeon]|nr:ATP-binding protein [Candidatus Bathyarchaeota archaeon]